MIILAEYITNKTLRSYRIIVYTIKNSVDEIYRRQYVEK
jgi:hypothetical protein